MLDIEMPGMTGIEVARAVRDKRLPTRGQALTASWPKA